ncbi:MAG: DUF4422 domain-containing protein [Aeriscardovia sp.]|nr:DUF4422 domain-containing protein [Aeriscardovia sp.]
METIKVIVAAHLEYEMPKDHIYLPVFVGAALQKERAAALSAKGYLADDSGENISEKNGSYCELTGLYWAWQNLDADYLGLVHYRRHFKESHGGSKAILTEQELRSLLHRFRLIVPEKRHYYIESLYSHYEHTHYADHLKKAREMLRTKCPEYLPSYDCVMRRSWGYMFNMMIMERGLFNDYCSWLFDILFEVERHVPPIDDPVQSRIYGYMSERLINVFCEHYHLRIKHVPLIMPLDEYSDHLNICSLQATYRRITNDIIYTVTPLI